MAQNSSTKRRRGTRSVAGWSVMKSKCSTCPFGPKGDARTASGVVERTITLEASQICHHPALSGKPETHLCRGARDIQLRLLTSFGILSEPTDEAFAAKSKELGV